MAYDLSDVRRSVREVMEENLADFNRGRSQKGFILEYCPECGDFVTGHFGANSFAPRSGWLIHSNLPCSKADSNGRHKKMTNS